MMLLLALSGTAFAPINHGGAVEVLDVLEKWAEIPPTPDSRRMLQTRDLAAAKAKAERAAFVVVDITIQDNCEKAWQTFSEAPLAGRVKTARALSSSVHLSVSRLLSGRDRAGRFEEYSVADRNVCHQQEAGDRNDC